MYQLPKSVIIRGREFNITNDGDFRMVLDCFAALRDEDLSEDLRVLASLLIFYNEFNSYKDLIEYTDYLEDLVKEMYKFFQCGQENSPGAKVNKVLIDWEQDEQIICSAINNVAGYEVRNSDYMHWWTFLGYFMAIGESVMSTVLSIRNKIVSHKKLEKWEREFKNNNPEYFHWKSTTVVDRETERLVRELWNKGGEE